MSLRLVPDEEVAHELVACEDCRVVFSAPRGWLPRAKRMICSRCWAVRAEAYRKLRMEEAHKKPAGLPPAKPIPQERPRPQTLPLFKT